MLTNTLNVALPMAVWLATDNYMYAKTSNELSTTTIMKSLRNIIGSRRIMYPEEFPPEVQLIDSGIVQDLDIQSKIASSVGTAIHSAVEQSWLHNHEKALKLLGYPESVIKRVLVNPEPEDIKPDSICIYLENRSYKQVENFVISGQYDLVVDGQIHDIKTTSTYSYTSGINDDKYILQMSIYRWLNPELITKDTGVINFLFTDWNKFEALRKDTYPAGKVLSKEYKLMSIEETEQYILNKVHGLQKFWNSPLAAIPCCSDKEVYAKPPVYKYYKTGYAEGKRATKVFNSMAEASAYRATQGNVGEIKEVFGDPFYCPFCVLPEPTQNSNLFNSNVSTITIE